jgi:hypothetical protein
MVEFKTDKKEVRADEQTTIRAEATIRVKETIRQDASRAARQHVFTWEELTGCGCSVVGPAF